MISYDSCTWSRNKGHIPFYRSRTGSLNSCPASVISMSSSMCCLKALQIWGCIGA